MPSTVHLLLGLQLLLAAPAALAHSTWSQELIRPERNYRVRCAGDQLELFDSRGRKLASLLPELLLASSRTDRPPMRRTARLPTSRLRFSGLQCQARAGGGFQATARILRPNIHYELTLEHTAGQAWIDSRLKRRFLKARLVQNESLSWRLAQPEAVMLDRAYRWREVRQASFSGSLTPHRLRLRSLEQQVELELHGGEGVQGLMIAPARAGGHRLLLELDRQDNHPFRPMLGCVLNPKIVPGTLRMDATYRAAGSQVSSRWRWMLGPAESVLPERYPGGARAALVFTDHADPSNARQLEAFAFGREGALAAGERGPEYPGFVNRGLGYTKTIFLRQAGRYAAQFEDPSYRRLLDELVTAGVELGVHSISGHRDLPSTSVEALHRFQQSYGGRTWIDHQPNTNCESIVNLGWRARGRWTMLGLLAATGFRFLANAEDVPMRRGSLNLLSPELPMLRRPLIYPSGRLLDDEGLPFIQFSSSWMYVRHERFVRWFSEAALDRFEAERGLLISHVYFDTFKTRRGRDNPRSLLLENPEGRLMLRPEVDRVFVELARRQADGRLWTGGIEALSEHILAALNIELLHLPQGRLEIRNRATWPLSRMSLLLPPTVARAEIEGRQVALRQTDEGPQLGFSLPAERALQIQVFDARGAPHALLLPARVSLEER